MVKKIKSFFGWVLLFVSNMIGIGWSFIEKEALAVDQAISLLCALVLLLVALLTGFLWLFILSGLFAAANIISTISFFVYILYVRKENIEKIKNEFFC